MVFKIFLIVICLFLPLVAQGTSLIDINTSPSKELEKIIGIGPVLAQRTIEARPFNSLDDLINVKGIGEKTLQKIKDQGLAWVNSQEKLEPKPEPEPLLESSDENLTGQAEPKKETTENSSLLTDRELFSVSYPAGVVFSEVLPSPEGPDMENEWIEIFNQNNFKINISSWKIKDKIGTPAVYVFPTDSKVPPSGYLILKRPDSKITLNNSGDGLELVNPNNEIADSVIFKKAPRNQSYNKISGNWVWSAILTPGTKNIASATETEKKSLPAKPLVEKEPVFAKHWAGKKETAAVKEKIPKTSIPFSVLLISFAIAVFSAIIILTLKKALTQKLNNSYD